MTAHPSLDARMIDELYELLRIPSISSGGGDPADLTRAAEWLRGRVEAAGGTAEVVTTHGNPLLIGRLDSSSPGVPTVLVYGHYDVQSADPVEVWDTPPFEPTIVDGRLMARGASDDKGNFYPLLYAACELAENGELPVNVRVIVEGEEEVGSENITDWILNHDEGADCAVIFDSLMLDPKTPAITLGTRGIVAAEIHVRTAARNLHSGMYGGAALNAVHVLEDMLAAVRPGPDGRLRQELRQGLIEPTPEELEAWSRLPSGDTVLAEVGARPIFEGSGREFYPLNWADASLDVAGIAGGDALQRRTIIPAEASAQIGMRLAPNQEASAMAEVLEGLLRAAVHPEADVDLDIYGLADPVLVDPSSPAIQIAAGAIERAAGTPPTLLRIGGTLPIMAALGRRGVPTILTGYALAEDNIHAPNEGFRLTSLDLCHRTARELLAALGTLPH